MSVWSAQAAKRDDEARELAKLRLEKTVQDRRIINTKGDALWANLRALIGQKCRELNSEPGKIGLLSCDANFLGCRVWITGSPLSINGRFGEGTIGFVGSARVRFEGYWEVNLNPDGLGVWLSDQSGCVVGIEDIAGTIIDSLLASRY